MARSEYLANLYLDEAAAAPRSAAQAGDLFATRGPVRVYRKPSIVVRILRAIGL